jgi:hypothetical protein
MHGRAIGPMAETMMGATQRRFAGYGEHKASSGV